MDYCKSIETKEGTIVLQLFLSLIFTLYFMQLCKEDLGAPDSETIGPVTMIPYSPPPDKKIVYPNLQNKISEVKGITPVVDKDGRLTFSGCQATERSDSFIIIRSDTGSNISHFIYLINSKKIISIRGSAVDIFLPRNSEDKGMCSIYVKDEGQSLNFYIDKYGIAHANTQEEK